MNDTHETNDTRKTMKFIVITPELQKREVEIPVPSQEDLDRMAQGRGTNNNQSPPETENIDDPIQKVKRKIEKFGIWRAILITTLVVIISMVAYWLFFEILIPAFNATEKFSESEKIIFRHWFWGELIVLIAGTLGFLLYAAIKNFNSDSIDSLKTYFIWAIPGAIGLFVFMFILMGLRKIIVGIIIFIIICAGAAAGEKK